MELLHWEGCVQDISRKSFRSIYLGSFLSKGCRFLDHQLALKGFVLFILKPYRISPCLALFDFEIFRRIRSLLNVILMAVEKGQDIRGKPNQ